MPQGTKLSNSYKRAFGRVFDNTPKAVFAAVAFSFAFKEVQECGSHEAVLKFMNEWDVLHLNGIVPQKPCWKQFNEMKEAIDAQS